MWQVSAWPNIHPQAKGNGNGHGLMCHAFNARAHPTHHKPMARVELKAISADPRHARWIYLIGRKINVNKGSVQRPNMTSYQQTKACMTMIGSLDTVKPTKSPSRFDCVSSAPMRKFSHART